MKKIIEREKRLVEVEEKILEIKHTLGDEGRRKSFARGVAMPVFEGRLRNANRPLEEELDRLETERKFILDARNNLLSRIVWNFAVPITVSFVTAYLVSKFLN